MYGAVAEFKKAHPDSPFYRTPRSRKGGGSSGRVIPDWQVPRAFSSALGTSEQVWQWLNNYFSNYQTPVGRLMQYAPNLGIPEKVKSLVGEEIKEAVLSPLKTPEMVMRPWVTGEATPLSEWLSYLAGGGPFGYVGKHVMPGVGTAAQFSETLERIPAVTSALEQASSAPAGQAYSDLMSLVLTGLEAVSGIKAGVAAGAPLLSSRLASLIPLTLPLWGGAAMRAAVGDISKILEEGGVVKVEPAPWERPDPQVVVIEKEPTPTVPAAPPLDAQALADAMSTSLTSSLLPAIAAALARYMFQPEAQVSSAGLFGGGAPFFRDPDMKRKKKKKKKGNHASPSQ
jgi:hypothetical protein